MATEPSLTVGLLHRVAPVLLVLVLLILVYSVFEFFYSLSQVLQLASHVWQAA